jgi:hypothetical protein
VRGQSAPRRGKPTATTAREMTRGGRGTVTGVDQRPRGRGGLSWCASTGGQRREKKRARRLWVAPLLNSTAGSRGRGGDKGLHGAA